MHADDNNEHTSSFNGVDVESSFPELIEHLPSSPPPYKHTQQFASMEQDPSPKPEPPPTRDASVPRPAMKRISSDPDRPPSGQQAQIQQNENHSSSAEENEEDVNPGDRIADFDWDDLQQRYEEAMMKCRGEEEEIMADWGNLMAYFRIWAESGHEHETNRTYSRLQTRMTHVQNSEEKLEKTRNHYINVVKAFESALSLLQATGMGR